MEKIKEKYGWLLENGFIFIVFLLVTFGWVSTGRNLNYDLAWCFHMSQKVANGHLLYSEISTVVMPLYFWFGGLFIKVFGNALITMHIYSGAVWGIIAVTIYNIVKMTTDKKIDLTFSLFVLFILRYSSILALSNYNSFAVMWWLIAIYVEIKREKNEQIGNETKSLFYNVLIGVMLGCAFFSKQNIGFFAVVATGLVSIIKWIINRKNNLKEILAKALGFFVVTLMMLIYFIFTNTFSDCLEFCFGGLFEFGKENIKFFIHGKYYILAIILVIAIIIAKKKKDKVLMIEIINQIALCGLAYPLTNDYHVILSMLMSFPILLRITNYFYENKKIYYLLFIFNVIWSLVLSTYTEQGNTTEFETIMRSQRIGGELFSVSLLLLVMNIGVSFATGKNKISNVFTVFILILTIASHKFIHNEIVKEEYLVDGLEVYQNLGFTEEQLGRIENVIEYILTKEKEGYNVYVVSADAAYYMMALGRNNYKYDLTLYGSLGSEGEEGLI